MRLEVGMVRTFSCVALTGAVLICGYAMFGLNTGVEHVDAPSISGLHFIATYGLTTLAFAACPRLRRIELVKALVLLSLTAELARRLSGHPLQVSDIIADMAGVVAVFVPSFTERFRSLMRADQHEPFSMVYPQDRRRRSRRTKASSRPAQPSPTPSLSA